MCHPSAYRWSIVAVIGRILTRCPAARDRSMNASRFVASISIAP